MSGTLALAGSGEFLAVMRPVDALLIERAGGAGRAHVVVIPTAAVPDGPSVVARWAEMGRTHFAALGATVDIVAIRAGDSADDPGVAARVAAAQLIYFSGGKPAFLLGALRGTQAWAAVTRVYAAGGVVAGCSAGAMILGAALLVPRLRWPLATEPAFGLVPGCAILPHYDAIPAPLRELARRGLPAALTLVGIDEDTALMSEGEGWRVLGRGGVELGRAGGRERYRSGDRLRFGQAGAGEGG